MELTLIGGVALGADVSGNPHPGPATAPYYPKSAAACNSRGVNVEGFDRRKFLKGSRLQPASPGP